MEEVIVALACLQQKGCDETSRAYYMSRPELAQLVNVEEKRIKENLPPIVVQYVAPMAAIAFFPNRAVVNVKLVKGLSLGYKVDRTTMTYNWDFK